MTTMDIPTTRFTLTEPMFIGARLMPAARVAASTIHVCPHRRDAEDRIVWRYIIEDSDGYVLDDATDLSSGTGDDIDPRKALATLAEFLTAAADAYRHTLDGHPSDNDDLFPPDVSEWAYQHDNELAALTLALELDTDQPDSRSPDAVWQQVCDSTGCADCAGNAAQGQPYGPEHCWATHRPHTPITRDQGDRR